MTSHTYTANLASVSQSVEHPRRIYRALTRDRVRCHTVVGETKEETLVSNEVLGGGPAVGRHGLEHDVDHGLIDEWSLAREIDPSLDIGRRHAAAAALVYLLTVYLFVYRSIECVVVRTRLVVVLDARDARERGQWRE